MKRVICVAVLATGWTVTRICRRAHRLLTFKKPHEMVTVGAVAEALEIRMPSPELRVTTPALLTVNVVALDPLTIRPSAGAEGVVET